jgi:hypothetical protein
VERRLSEQQGDALDRALLRLGPHVARVELSYRSTRRQMFAWTRDANDGVVRLRAHRALRSAPNDVADAVWRVALGSTTRAEARALTHRVNAWFLTRPLDADAPTGRTTSGRNVDRVGGFVDLRAAFEAMRAARLETPIEADVVWAARRSARVFARYERGALFGRIVVNPLLDAPLTPAWYLDFLLFHEALHAVFPPRPGAGRMIMHPPEFRAAEREHPEFARSRTFERWATGDGRDVLGRRRLEADLLPPPLR